MDSFYDQPRRHPHQQGVPSTTNRLPPLPTTVPDASMLLQNTGNIPTKNAEMSYNAWKYQLRGKATASGNKENTGISKDSLYRKQVRFETPQPTTIRPHVPNFDILPMRPSLVQRPQSFQPKTAVAKVGDGLDRFGMPRSSADNKILQAKPFEKIYMANVPNRNLDLSIIEPPRNYQLQRSNSAPESDLHASKPFYKGYTQNTEPSVESTERIPMASSTTLEVRTPARLPCKSLEVAEKPSDDEPSVKDLLKIIQQQNQQLMCLQEQVSTLIKERSQQPQIEAPPANNPNWQEPVFKNKILDNVLNAQAHNVPPRANKFAIDVMTSFEVSIRAPNGNRFNGRRFPGVAENQEYGKATITEILDDSKTGKTDLSLKLDEPVVVDERCPSPENSIHVDMKDFSSDDEDGTTANMNNSIIGWTIYNNVMDQVNFMLHKSTEKQGKVAQQNQQYTGAIMKQVKEATLKHLQKVGVNLNNIEEDITISSDTAYTPTEVSFAVKQLLMKYLPDEQLAKLTLNNQPKTNTPPATKLIKRRPDFSMATVQYMKKYNLLNCDSNNRQNPIKSTTPEGKISSDKMLDITALKQQPKLL